MIIIGRKITIRAFNRSHMWTPRLGNCRNADCSTVRKRKSSTCELAVQGMKVRVGMEASGHARWFERLLGELQFELWIGDAAEIRTRRVRKQKTDRPGCAARF